MPAELRAMWAPRKPKKAAAATRSGQIRGSQAAAATAAARALAAARTRHMQASCALCEERPKQNGQRQGGAVKPDWEGKARVGTEPSHGQVRTGSEQRRRRDSTSKQWECKRPTQPHEGPTSTSPRLRGAAKALARGEFPRGTPCCTAPTHTPAVPPFPLRNNHTCRHAPCMLWG